MGVFRDKAVRVPLCLPLTSRLPRARYSEKHSGTERKKVSGD